MNIIQRNNRLTYIDLARGLSAFAVLIVHYRWFYDPPIWANPVAGAVMPLRSLLWPFYDYGGLAVQMFWLLSGVVFAASYGAADGYFDWRKFAVWRFSRLYPLHITTLIIVVFIQFYAVKIVDHEQIYVGNNDPYHFVLQIFLASNWGFENGDSFNAPIWSVSVEVLIYGAFAAYILFTNRSVGTAILIAIAFGVILYLFRSNIAFCGLFFFLGFIITKAAAHVETRGRLFGAIVLCVMCLLVIFIKPIMAPLKNVLPPFYYVVLPLMVAAILICDAIFPPIPRRFHWIGDITYATYLLHMPIMMIMKTGLQATDRMDLLNSPWILLTYLSLVIGLSVPTYRYFELPLQNWLRSHYRARTSIATRMAKSAVT